MSGLPVLVMGANGALLALVASVQPEPNPFLITSSAGIALLLILLAFRIRAGHAAWIPFVLTLFFAFMAASFTLSYLEWTLAGQTQIGGAQVALRWVVPIICLILVVGGFRGWRWLKSHGEKVSF